MRNRYLDLLRAAAILRVIVYHLFGWPWLTILLPAMGVMFALAGSLMAASLDNKAAGTVLRSRLRRLLPPLWAFGLVAVPLMIAGGWPAEDGEHPFSWAQLAFWLVPIGDPTGSDRGIDLWEPLWYLRAYLWFVVLSPLLYPIYRRIGWAAVVAPLALLAVLDTAGFSLPDVADTALWDFGAYGACWIAGFAHHDGRLARTKPWIVIATAVGIGAASLYWLAGHAGADGMDLNDVPESQALWSLAFVLVVLRWQPSTGWLDRAVPISVVVTLLNSRAVTIYLWHNVMIAVAWPLLARLALDDLGPLNAPVTLLTVLLLTAAATMAFGWVEDLAARSEPRFWPSTTGRRSTAPVAGTANPVSAAVPDAAVPDATPPVPDRLDPTPGGTDGGTDGGALDPAAAGSVERSGGPAVVPTQHRVGGDRGPGGPWPTIRSDADDPDPTPVVPLHVPVGRDGLDRSPGHSGPDSGPLESATAPATGRDAADGGPGQGARVSVPVDPWGDADDR